MISVNSNKIKINGSDCTSNNNGTINTKIEDTDVRRSSDTDSVPSPKVASEDWDDFNDPVKYVSVKGEVEDLGDSSDPQHTVALPYSLNSSSQGPDSGTNNVYSLYPVRIASAISNKTQTSIVPTPMVTNSTSTTTCIKTSAFRVITPTKPLTNCDTSPTRISTSSISMPSIEDTLLSMPSMKVEAELADEASTPTSTSSTVPASGYAFIWDDNSVQFLLDTIYGRLTDLNDKAKKKKKVWGEITTTLNSALGTTFTPEQTHNKYRQEISKFKKFKSKILETGVKPLNTPKFFDEMENLVGNSLTFTLQHMAEVGKPQVLFPEFAQAAGSGLLNSVPGLPTTGSSLLNSISGLATPGSGYHISGLSLPTTSSGFPNPELDLPPRISIFQTPSSDAPIVAAAPVAGPSGTKRSREEVGEDHDTGGRKKRLDVHRNLVQRFMEKQLEDLERRQQSQNHLVDVTERLAKAVEDLVGHMKTRSDQRARVLDRLLGP